MLFTECKTLTLYVTPFLADSMKDTHIVDSHLKPYRWIFMAAIRVDQIGFFNYRSHKCKYSFKLHFIILLLLLFDWLKGLILFTPFLSFVLQNA